MISPGAPPGISWTSLASPRLLRGSPVRRDLHMVQFYGLLQPQDLHAGKPLTMCKSGNRSAKALDIARKLGFNRARHYKGGYTEWQEREDN